MSTPNRRSHVDSIRDAARLEVEARSLRAVARAIGMSPMGLKHFIEGTQPYSATFRKLTAWYVVYQADAGGFSVETVRGALTVLTDGIPEVRRRDAERAVLDDLAKLHGELGTRPPEWLTRLRGEPDEE
ncbi:MAG TPA: hypothetical protein VJT67_10430 [Longimicrobiaceae bacterium]|nr:hypothetical protein [Longimicrobiaceae bacterium]